MPCIRVFPLVFLSLLPALAHSQYAPGDRERNHTLSLQPVLLSVPIVALQYEARLTEAFGVAAWGGYGRFEYERAGDPVEGTAYGLGLQSRFYAFDRHRDARVRFGEPHAGVQVAWIHGEDDERDDGFLGALNGGGWSRGEQLLVGPFVGYKYVASFGLTAEAQLGAQAGVRYPFGRVNNSGPGDDPRWEFGWAPIANVGVGWSF